MRRNILTAYFLWLFCCILICGLHRLYCGKTFTGLLWLCTFGLLGVGQALDFLLMPMLVAEANDDCGSHRINIRINNSSRASIGSRRRYDYLDELDELE